MKIDSIKEKQKRQKLLAVSWGLVAILFSVWVYSYTISYSIQNSQIEINGIDMGSYSYIEWINSRTLLFSILFFCVLALMAYAFYKFSNRPEKSVAWSSFFQSIKIFSLLIISIFVIFFLFYRYIIFWSASDAVINMRFDWDENSIDFLSQSLASYFFFGILFVSAIFPIVLVLFVFSSFIVFGDNRWFKKEALMSVCDSEEKDNYAKSLHISYLIYKIFIVALFSLSLVAPFAILHSSTNLVLNKCDIYNNINIALKKDPKMFTKKKSTNEPPEIQLEFPWPFSGSFDFSLPFGYSEKIENSAFVMNSLMEVKEKDLEKSCNSDIK